MKLNFKPHRFKAVRFLDKISALFNYRTLNYEMRFFCHPKWSDSSVALAAEEGSLDSSLLPYSSP